MVHAIQPINTAAATNANAASAATNTDTGLPTGQSLNNMFLQLLVAQLQNQSPLDPMDPSQFVGQLAQFSELSEVTSIYQLLSQFTPGSGTSGSTPTTTAPTGTPEQNVLAGSSQSSQAAVAPADGLSDMVQQALAKIQGGH